MALPPEQSGFAQRANIRRNSIFGNVLCSGSMILWAAGFPAAEILLETWSVLGLISARLLMAVLFLCLVWLIIEGPQTVLRARWGRGIIVGGIGFGLGTWLLLKAQALTDPVTVAIFASAAPVTAALLEVLTDGRRISRGYVLGMIAAVTGGIVATGANGGAGMAGFGLGALAVLLSILLFSWGSLSAVRTFPELSHLGRATVTLAGGLLFCGTAYLIAVHTGLDRAPSAPVDIWQLEMLAIYSLAAMALSQLFWMSSVGRLGVSLASFHMNIAPFYVMLIMLALGAAWSWPQAIGAAIVAFGVVLAQR